MTTMIPAYVGDTLTPVEKLEVHRKGLKHLAVSVFVMVGNKVLLQRRALSKYHTPGLWANTCCTHPDWNEAPAACAQRRLNEELGISGLTPVHRDRVEYRADVGGGLTEHEVVDIYVAEAKPDVVVAPNPDEVAETAWVDLGELSDRVARRPEQFTPWLRIYLADHSARIFRGLIEA